jgi:hypothetical protein
MSKGSRIVPVRMPPYLYAKLLECIERANRGRKYAPYSVGEWIRQACREKVDHLQRSKRKPKPPTVVTTYEFRDVNGHEIMSVKMPPGELADFLESNPSINHYVILLDG